MQITLKKPIALMLALLMVLAPLTALGVSARAEEPAELMEVPPPISR